MATIKVKQIKSKIGAPKAAMAAIKPMCELQTELSKELGTDVKREYCHEVNDEDLRQTVVADGKGKGRIVGAAVDECAVHKIPVDEERSLPGICCDYFIKLRGKCIWMD